MANDQESALLKQQLMQRLATPVQQYKAPGAENIMDLASKGWSGPEGKGGDWVGGALGGLTGIAQYLNTAGGKNILAGQAAGTEGGRDYVAPLLGQAEQKQGQEAAMQQAMAQREAERQKSAQEYLSSEDKQKIEEAKALVEAQKAITERAKGGVEASKGGQTSKDIYESIIKGTGLPTKESGLWRKTITGERLEAAKPQVIRTGSNVQLANKGASRSY